MVMRPIDKTSAAAPADMLAVTGTSHCLFGDNSQIRRICDIVRKVARSRGPVLLRGESGTGKEVLARALHLQSPRSDKPFVPVNAGSLPRELVESELFGHVKGAYTGADRDRIGRFDEADGGTLFLDEIGDMPVEQQVKLLRILQSGEVRPIGSTRSHRVDVRVVAATNRDLEALVREGRFREDLYYRLSLFVITIPPLRERHEDIPALAESFLERFAEEQQRPAMHLAGETRELLLEYAWPGNIRELENAMHYAVTMCDGEIIQPVDLPGTVRTCTPPFARTGKKEPAPNSASQEATIRPLADVEREHILAVYDALGHQKAGTARALGISVRSLQMKLKSWNVS
ncbi:MAG TPA: sigma-54 dependent transcriptional regulator [Candidatus Ozemobacteraceae bacterium]|nr:sigma-54 dependent transcriptional regulator [Candidatus Ozemobacteraceae bacterium]